MQGRPTTRLRAALWLAVISTLLVGGAAASSTAVAAPSDAQATQTFKPVWVAHQRSVRAGSTVRFKLDPVTGTSCRVSLARRGASGPSLKVRGGLRLSAIRIRTSSRAASGRWKATARCAQPVGPALSAATRFKVRGGGAGALAARGAAHVKRVAPYSGGPAGRVEGKGAGNRFDSRQCTSWAYEKRSDVYDRAVQAGVPGAGLVTNPAFREDYVWNGRRWAENARRAGIPTGTKPVAGALYVNTIGKYGHVAYVERVLPDGSFEISERNATGRGDSTRVTKKIAWPRPAWSSCTAGLPATRTPRSRATTSGTSCSGTAIARRRRPPGSSVRTAAGAGSRRSRSTTASRRAATPDRRC
jgi:surface antigen